DAEDQAEQRQQRAQPPPPQFLERFAPGRRDHGGGAFGATGADFSALEAAGPSTIVSPARNPSSTCVRLGPRMPTLSVRVSERLPSRTTMLDTSPLVVSAMFGTVSVLSLSSSTIIALKPWPGAQ